MPRICTICTNPDRQEIDRQLVEGAAFPAIAALHRVSTDALGRHKANHIPAQLVEAQTAETASQADELLARIASLDADARSIFDQAKRKGDFKTALSALREQARVVELLAKIKGELDERAQININNQVMSVGATGLPKWDDANKIVWEVLTRPNEAIQGTLENAD